MSDSYNVTADELRAFVERYEQLESEKKDVAAQQKQVIDELSGRGYDKKVFRKIVALRKKNKDEIAEEDAILQLYMKVLGMI